MSVLPLSDGHKASRRAIACKSCHSLKVKCTPADELDPSGPCLRCLNLKRVCEIDLSQTRKRRKKEDAAGSHGSEEEVRRLKDEIAGLRRELEHTKQASQNASSGASNGFPTGPFILKADLEKEVSALCGTTPAVSDLTNTLRAYLERRNHILHQDLAIDVVSAGIISLEEARERLDLFRSDIFKSHPLVEIPAETTVDAMIQNEPFLLNAVLLASNAVYSKNASLDNTIRLDSHAIQTVVVEIMVAGAKTVELVKSLIVLCLWYNAPESFGQRRYHLLNMVAVTLLHDLGIVARPTFGAAHGAQQAARDEETHQTLEYKLLIMVLYFMTVNILLVLRRAIYVKWTPYVEACCVELEKSDVPKWGRMALYSRLSHELERIHHIFHAPEAREGGQKPPQYILLELQKKLGMIRTRFAADDHLFAAYFYSVEAYLHEPILGRMVLDAVARAAAAGAVAAAADSKNAASASGQYSKDFNNSLVNVLADTASPAAHPLFHGPSMGPTSAPVIAKRNSVMALDPSKGSSPPAEFPQDTIESIAHCTKSCLNAIDAFNEMLPHGVAAMPLLYASRIIYTAGMLLRLRYLILLLPSYIEKDLVPRKAVLAVQKLNHLVEKAALQHPSNHFLKKIRLVVQLFVQTYVAQVLELLRKNDSQNEVAGRFNNHELAEMQRLSEMYKRAESNGLITTDSGKPYGGQVPLDLLLYAASYRQEHPNSGPDSQTSPGKTPLAAKTEEYDSNPRLLPHATEPPRLESASPGQIPQMGYLYPWKGPFSDMLDVGGKASNFMPPPEQLETSYMTLNDEFWLNLLDVENLNFPNGLKNPPNEEVFFMS